MPRGWFDSKSWNSGVLLPGLTPWPLPALDTAPVDSMVTPRMGMWLGHSHGFQIRMQPPIYPAGLGHTQAQTRAPTFPY